MRQLDRLFFVAAPALYVLVAAPAASQARNQDTAAVVAAVVPSALNHLKDLLPAGPVALDTTAAGLATVLHEAGTRLSLAAVDFSDIRVCEMLRCTFRSVDGPRVVIALRGVNRNPPLRIGSDSATATLEIWWMVEPDRLSAAGRIVEVQLVRRGAVWQVARTRTLWDLH
jgi:hypothetical protein